MLTRAPGALRCSFCQWPPLTAVTFPGFPFGIRQIVLGIWTCDRNPYLPALLALKSEGLRRVH